MIFSSLFPSALPRPRPTEPGERIFQPPAWDWVAVGEVGWWVRPDWSETLLGPEGLRLAEWRESGQLAKVKESPQRVVYRVDLPEGSIYIKHFLVPTWRETLRQWFRRGKGRNEGKRALRLAQTGVPTITPIALGERRRRKFLFENYLITRGIPGAVPLNEFVEGRLDEIPEPRRSRLRRELARALGELTARLHEVGFVHQDFHPGNLLVDLTPEGRPWLAMIDLDALRVRRKLTWKDVGRNLALLNHYFWLRSNRTDRHRFLRAYLAARSDRPRRLKAFARGIEEATRAWAERLWRRWGRRCLATNKYFQAYQAPRAWAVASRDLDAATVAALLADPDAPFRHPGAALLKDSRTTTVAELELPVLGRPRRVIYKRFNRKKWLDPWLCLFRPSRAWRAWQAGQHLASRAVPTPQNLAVIARTGSLGLPLDTYLVTIKAEPSITLSDYARTTLAGLDPTERREQIRRLTPALARLIRTLHERSLSQRDLKAANILIEGDPSAGRLSLIDLVGVRLVHPLPRGRRLQNLARLQVSLADVSGRTRTDALRFLRFYLPWAQTPRRDWKALWRAIQRRCRAKEARNRRRGRPLS
ncbi:MAG: phosphotransferase [Isosphaeraceae bacterium]|nr:phosphotransferase [Isosphaeraceae bacterium]